jgi:protein-S-isoprenylcysteine O-methyltransferase Ste14
MAILFLRFAGRCQYILLMRVLHWIVPGLAVLGVATGFLMTKPTDIAWPPTRIAGVCLLLLSVVWVVIARIQLGHAFTITAQARQLVTTGLYSRIRNPIYVASPFVLVALALVLTQWWPMLLLIVVVPLQIVRARRERRVLSAAFGTAYEEYRARTWF